MKRVYAATVFALSVLALPVFALLASAAPAAAESVPKVVVELFTSQGDAMCGPADKLLAKLAGQRDVLALSLPVDTWDMMGWKDTLATPANSKRQRAYAAALGKSAVYTPQIVVDGSIDLVGSREAAVRAAIKAERASMASCRGKAAPHGKGTECRTLCPVDVAIVDVAQNRLRIALGDAPQGCRKDRLEATVWLFSLRDFVAVPVGGGENAGRTLKYRNVVRAIKAVGVWRGEAASFLVRDMPEADSVAVVVQQDGYGPVLGAASMSTARHYARQ